MGSNTSEFDEQNRIEFSEWQEIAKTPTMIIMRNIKTLIEAELHNVILRQTDNFNQEMATYFKRKNPKQSLVKVYGVQVDDSNLAFICKQRICLKVLTQRIPVKFPDIPQLSFPDSLYLLIQLLKGYRVIYKQTGIFQISRNMIGLNLNSQVRMWANQNYAVNHPTGYTPIPQTLDSQQVFSRQQYRNIFAKASKNESKMINRIVQLMQAKSVNRKFPEQFKNVLNTFSNSFQEVLHEIQKYCSENNISVPNKLKIQVQSFNRNRKSDVGPMKPFKNLRKNQHKPEKPIFSRKQNIHLHEQDYFTETLTPQQPHLGKLKIKTERVSANLMYLRPSTDRANYNQSYSQTNRFKTQLRTKNLSPFSKSNKKDIENVRGSSTPSKIGKRVQSEQSVSSPSFLRNKNKEKNLGESSQVQKNNETKRKIARKRDNFSPKLQSMIVKPTFSNKNTYKKQSPIRKTYSPERGSRSNEKTIRNTLGSRKPEIKTCRNNNNNESFFLFSKPTQKVTQEKRSISFDVMNLKIALHSRSDLKNPISASNLIHKKVIKP